MELKPGYKQTEIGMIPNDWQVHSLSQVGRVIRGASPRPKGDKRYYGGSVPRLMVEDVTRDGKFVTPSIDFLTQEGAKKSRPCVKGTLTIVCSGTVGIPSLLAVDACVHDGFLALIELNRNLVGDYLFHQLASLKERFNLSATHGGVFTNLTTSILGEFKVAFPPPNEQRAIAEALSDGDALISALDQLIAKKRDLKKAAMQQLLTGKRRLPGFNGELGYKQTEVGMIPADWEVKKLVAIAAIATGNTPPTRNPANYGKEFLFVSPVDLGDGKYITQTEKMLSAQGFAISRRFPKNSILFVCIGSTIGKCGIASVALTSNQQINAILPSSGFSSEFLYYSLCLSAPKIRAQAGEQAVPIVNKTDFSETAVPVPLLTEQRAIATVLSDMDTEIAALERRRDKTRAFKQGMMQALLTGKTRLV